MKLRESLRLQALTHHEKLAYLRGYHYIAGIDEVGRGPLAGPVLACACIIPKGLFFAGVDDSKKLSPETRESLFEKISSHADVSYGFGVVSHDEIDRINIYQATIKAMLQAISQLPAEPDYLLVDGMALPHPTIPCKKIIGGDRLSHSIAAASILAKVERDRLMKEYHTKWPAYGFKDNKGYGTKKHIDVLQKIGPSPIHRLSFKVKKETTEE